MCGTKSFEDDSDLEKSGKNHNLKARMKPVN